MSRRMQKVVEISSEKIGMGKAKGGRSREEMRGKGKAEERKNGRDQESG